MENSKTLNMDEMYPYIKGVIEAGGEFKLITAGTSMLPMLRDRCDTAVLVKKHIPSKKYDVVLYIRDSGQFVLHRIVGKNADGYIMCGDNQYVLEKGIRENQIVAVLKAYIKDQKRTECSDFKYKTYSFIRCFTRTPRFFLIRVKRKLKRVILRNK